MDIFEKEDLDQLSRRHAAFCVSIYLPTFRAGRESRQSAIRFKNLVTDVERRLDSELRRRSSDAKDVVSRLKALRDDGLFWSYQGDGLAVFADPEYFRYFRLPTNFEELSVVADRFHLKPLIRLVSRDGRFFLLALSLNGIRFFEGTLQRMREIDLPDASTSLEEFERFVTRENQVQFHTRTPGAGEATRPAVFHGAGELTLDARKRLHPFFKQIDGAVRKRLRDSRAPLVLAATERLAALYREANTYPHLLQDIVPGSPEAAGEDELHEAAWKVVEPHFSRSYAAAVERFSTLRGKNSELASTDAKDIVAGAVRSRVETLFVPVGVQVWGRLGEAGAAVAVHDRPEAGDEDLLDLAAVRTLVSGGEVHAVAPPDVPAGARMAAIFRYARPGERAG